MIGVLCDAHVSLSVTGGVGLLSSYTKNTYTSSKTVLINDDPAESPSPSAPGHI